MRIHSDSFEHRQPIPAEFALGAPGGFGGNRNPHLAWDDAPAGTRSFALLCVDSDAPTDGALVAEAVAGGLYQRGLRPAQGNKAADLQVSAAVSLERRQYQVRDDYGSYYGHGPYGDHYGMYGSVPLVRTYEVEVAVVRIELYDGRDGQPVWSGIGEARSEGSQSERADALRRAVADTLGAYPPE